MTAKIPVNPRALNADYHSQVQACPVWTWGIAVHTARIAADLEMSWSVFIYTNMFMMTLPLSSAWIWTRGHPGYFHPHLLPCYFHCPDIKTLSNISYNLIHGFKTNNLLILTCKELRICCSIACTHSSRSSALPASKCHCLLSRETICSSKVSSSTSAPPLGLLFILRCLFLTLGVSPLCFPSSFSSPPLASLSTSYPVKVT